MRIFATSDIHTDYPVNRQWVNNVSLQDYTNDVLILAGDVSHNLTLVGEAVEIFVSRFKDVVFVPGNHDLWLEDPAANLHSTEKHQSVIDLAASIGAHVNPIEINNCRIVPLLSWYDYSFGPLTKELEKRWMDFQACRWPDHMTAADVTQLFLNQNELVEPTDLKTTITFSHFLPRIDLMPDAIPQQHRVVYPVLGTNALEKQLREVGSNIHVYGHSHLNRDIEIDGVRYINNAYANPNETNIARKDLFCIFED